MDRCPIAPKGQQEEVELLDNSAKIIYTGETDVVFSQGHLFNNFGELYATLPLLKCCYTQETIDTASPEDMNRYYSVEEQKLYGVVGIEIKLM